MGACTIIEEFFGIDSYSTIHIVDKLIHVDVYLLGFPHEPEAIIDDIMKLCERKESSMDI
jgi:NADH:ubiquinone oxidoreductase subunit B-like Fe-S oxidoreductase